MPGTAERQLPPRHGHAPNGTAVLGHLFRMKPVMGATLKGWYQGTRVWNMPRRRKASHSRSRSCSLSHSEDERVQLSSSVPGNRSGQLLSRNGSPITRAVLIEGEELIRLPETRLPNGHVDNVARPPITINRPSKNLSLKRQRSQRCQCVHEVPTEEDVRPSLDRFADDTSMLGFRYLHSRYKTWFRLLWSLLLIFFFGLTFYQVCERISYYFISNPLITTRFYNTPSQVDFPKVVLCNKMQIKALSETYDDNQKNAGNETIKQILTDFNSIDAFDFFISTGQGVDDLFVGCQFGKSRNCIDNVRPILTPSGYCFLVDLNTTVTRPGPEGTLQLLLNLETYESVPGWASEPGVVLSMFDSTVPFSNHFQEGMHLEPGKAVTIPINDVRRVRNQCGSDPRQQFIFKSHEYSRSACQWLARLRDIRERCKCEPSLSPTNREVFSNYTGFKPYAEPESTVRLTAGKAKVDLPACTIAEEVFCVHQDDGLSPEATKAVSECVNDCMDVTFTTIVFGNELHSSEVSHYLPGDWEDEKEKRLGLFHVGPITVTVKWSLQNALDYLPKNRISLVRHIQKIADDARQFMTDSSRVFGVSNDTSTSTIPCLHFNGTSFEEAVANLHEHESLWKGYAVFLEKEFSRHFGPALKLFNLEVDQNFRLRDDYDSSEKSEEYYVTLSTHALYALRVFENLVADDGKVQGLNDMNSMQKSLASRHLILFLHELQDCVLKLQFKPLDQVRNLTKPCQKFLLDYHSMIYDARAVAKSLSTEPLKEFIDGVEGLTAVLQKIKHDFSGSIFNIKDYNVNLRTFRNMYKEGGKGNELLVELLKFRKFIHSGAVEEIKKFVESLETAMKYRKQVVEHLGWLSVNSTSSNLKFVQNVVKCMEHLIPEIHEVKVSFKQFFNTFEQKSPMIRAELMSRINHEVTVAQSYLPGPEVNLLYLKIYFAHFKEEIIQQERSYNVFLLLAEIGGTIGLYVGAALLSLAETFVFFFEKNTLRFPLLKEPRHT